MWMASEDRRRQLPWVILGLTVTLTSAIIFALWASSLSDRTAVAVAGRDIPGGSTIEIEDLRAVEVAGGQGAGFVPMADLEAVVGRTVRAAIPEGAVLHPGLLSTSSPIDQGMAMVGAVLHPGEYPVAGLGPGQSVGVVITKRSFDDGLAGTPGHTDRAASGGTPARVPEATVAEVSELLDSGRDALFVSLLAPADDAVLIGNAAALNELRLILMPGEPRSADSSQVPQQSAAGADQ